MIRDTAKYKRFISFLSTISIFMFQYSNANALNITYDNNYSYMSNYSKVLDTNDKTFVNEKIKNKNINISEILSANISYNLNHIDDEVIDTEDNVEVVFLSVYLDLPDDVDDDLLIESSIKVSKIITEKTNKKYIVTYM